jgi:hypothetical protein
MDHYNSTHKNFITEHVMRWHLIIDEFGPKNKVADTLSCLGILLYEESFNMTDCYGLDDNDLPNDSFPLIYSLINCEQQQDEPLIAQAQKAQQYSLKKFHAGGLI